MVGWIIAISVALGVAVFTAFNAIQKCEKLEQITDTVIGTLEQVQGIVNEVDARLDDPKLRIAFESDDEVGVFFRKILEIRDELNYVLGGLEENVKKD